MTDLILVHPPTALNKLYSQFADGGSELPPLGLGYLAANAEEHGFKTRILDCMAEKMSIESAAGQILKEHPKVVGFSSYTIFMGETTELARLVRQRSDAKIVIGGGHITCVPELTMQRFPEFDVGALGEAEETLVDLLTAFRDGRDLSTVPGILYRNEGQVITNPRRPYIQNLDILPMPAWHKFKDITDPKYYGPPADSVNRYPSTSLITSRGCPANCTFCNLTMFGNSVRYHSPDYTMRMIRFLKEHYGIKELFFQDDTFVSNKKIVRQLCEKMMEEKVNLSWSCYGRVDFVNQEILKIMRQAGCWQISYGIETANQEILDNYNKKTNVEKIRAAVKWTRDQGMSVKGLFMLGNFLETRETMQKTMEFIKELNLTDFHMTYFTPFPGSLSYETAQQFGEFDPAWEKLDMFSPSFIPNGMTKDELENMYRKIYRGFYLRPRIMWYYFSKLRNLHFAKKLVKSALALLKFVFKPAGGFKPAYVLRMFSGQPV